MAGQASGVRWAIPGRRWLVLVFALAALVDHSSARACKLANPKPFMTDASQASDRVPPTLSTLSLAGVQRGRGPRRSGCGSEETTTCDGVGNITLGVSANDDLTPADRIGYRISMAGGTLPQGLTLPAGPVLPLTSEGQLWLHWDDGASDDQDSFDFTLEVVAVDLAGNESAPQSVRVQSDTGGGCRIATERR